MREDKRYWIPAFAGMTEKETGMTYIKNVTS